MTPEEELDVGQLAGLINNPAWGALVRKVNQRAMSKNRELFAAKLDNQAHLRGTLIGELAALKFFVEIPARAVKKLEKLQAKEK